MDKLLMSVLLLLLHQAKESPREEWMREKRELEGKVTTLLAALQEGVSGRGNVRLLTVLFVCLFSQISGLII